jgi:DNA repair exonuclease SbcCD ATPase subunit
VRFLRLYLKNFGAYEEAKMALAGQGVQAIVAQRDDSPAFDSNGAGKSTIFNALYWALTGDLPKKVPASEVVRRGSKGGCQVVLYTEDDDGSEVIIDRRRGGGARGANKISITANGEDVTPKGRGEPEKLIERYLGTSKAAFGYAAFFGSSEVFRFSEATDAKRKEILAHMLQFDLWSEALEKAKTEAADLEKTLNAEGASLEAYRSQLEDVANRITEEEARIAEEGAKIDGRLQSTAQELESARGALGGADAIVKKRTQAEALIQEKDGAISVLQSEAGKARVEWQAKERDALVEIRVAEAGLAEINAGICPTCGQRLPNVDPEAHLEAHQRNKLAAEARLKEARDQIHMVDTALAQNRQPLDEEKNTLKNMLGLIMVEMEKINRASDRVQNLEQQVEVLRRSKDNLRAGLNQLEAQAQRANEEITRLEASHAEKTAEFNLASFWSVGFGKKGIQAWLLDEVIPFLEERTNVYLLSLTDGAVVADFGTRTEGTKKSLEKLDISVVKDGHKAHVGTLSGGERRRFDLAMSFALHDLLIHRGVKSSCLFLDEIFDTLDETGADRVAEVIRQKKEFSGVESVFVISHSQKVVQAFHNKLVVRHRDGVSWLEETS